MSAPSFPEAEGRFSIDYRNSNGIIHLGSGDWSFETHWSSAGNGTIHAYRDGKNIQGVAVAPGCSMISEVTSSVLLSADFSSRTRTPRENEVVLWQNTNGKYAAILINRVTRTPESQSGTLLDAYYRILPDGRDDFSNEESAARSDAQLIVRDALTAVSIARSGDKITTSDGRAIGLGHNNPPSEANPDPAIVDETVDALDAAKLALLSKVEDRAEIEKIRNRLADASKKISNWVVQRIEEIASSAAKVIGAGMGTWLLASVANWEIVAERLALAASTFSRVFGL